MDHLGQLLNGVDRMFEQIGASDGCVSGELSQCLYALGVVEGEEQDHGDPGIRVSDYLKPLDGFRLQGLYADEHNIRIERRSCFDERFGGGVAWKCLRWKRSTES